MEHSPGLKASTRPPFQYVDVKGAAGILAISVHYLNRLRVEGGGPQYSSFGRAVRYEVSDLHKWAEERKSAPSVALVRPKRLADRAQ